ncbi:Hypoxia induced protein conserved region [Musa troglodytarum]|uniref:Hypoxia induced protein conserved region n=1 Tax=Musa troglodytarum TaxID=320322 RepID=A0A9E7GSW7_9LILI|nr:Hypoxia induced protein conserved region [Musa troglodytarum]
MLLLRCDQQKARERERSGGESPRKWVVEHKLRTVGCLWLGGIGSSIAYNWSQSNMKPSVKIIHARFVSIDLVPLRWLLHLFDAYSFSSRFAFMY